ncbi:MAG: hypothetical protein SFU25_09575 [Candidatus Caenarcaniphilales bacterium]|nr:hypothetical protein [Candidatus Caenarcaniphilales bacterium]
MNEKQITLVDSYKACYEFIKNYKYLLECSPDGVITLLSDMQLLEDTLKSADPAAWETWLECVEKVKNNEIDIEFRLSNPN